MTCRVISTCSNLLLCELVSMSEDIWISEWRYCEGGRRGGGGGGGGRIESMYRESVLEGLCTITMYLAVGSNEGQ